MLAEWWLTKRTGVLCSVSSARRRRRSYIVATFRPGTAATGLMDDIARHARRCSDAQDFGRIASISELRALTVKLADAFDLAQVVPPSAPAAPRVAAE